MKHVSARFVLHVVRRSVAVIRVHITTHVYMKIWTDDVMYLHRIQIAFRRERVSVLDCPREGGLC